MWRPDPLRKVVPGALVLALLASAEAVPAQTLSALIASVRETGKTLQAETPPDPTRLRAILAALERADAGVERIRERRETQAGDDEAALEALYESEDWLRMEHLQGEIYYWRGWAFFHLGGQLESGSAAAREAYRSAERAFARAIRSLRDPTVAREMILATAIAQREAGSPERSDATLDRVERVFADAPAEFHARVRLERARTAARRGNGPAVLAATASADPATAVGRELALLRLDWLLREPGAHVAELGATARTLLAAGGAGAGQAVARFEAKKLQSDTLDALGLGSEGDALVGLALLREERYADAADRLHRASRGSLVGLRDDVVMARLAEAELRGDRPEAAFATARDLRTRFPRSSLRGEVARFGYAAAQLWSQQNGGDPAAASAVSQASQWVLDDAPRSEEASEIRVRRALATASRSSPSRALHVLDALPEGASQSEAVALQKALLRSARLQTRLEESMRLTRPVRSEAQQLERLLRAVPRESELARNYQRDITLARARARLGLGHAGALELLLRLPSSFDVERTRIIALWLGGRPNEALSAAAELLEGSEGTPRDRYALTLPVALAASEQESGAIEAAPLRRLLAALRAAAPADTEPEFRYELALREASVAARSGQGEHAVALIEETLAEEPRARSNLILAAETLERGGRPDLATDVWHQLAETSEAGGSDWARARVGVARSLHATRGREEDGCAVAHSLLLSGRSLPVEAEVELQRLAQGCDGA